MLQARRAAEEAARKAEEEAAEAAAAAAAAAAGIGHAGRARGSSGLHDTGWTGDRRAKVAAEAKAAQLAHERELYRAYLRYAGHGGADGVRAARTKRAARAAVVSNAKKFERKAADGEFIPAGRVSRPTWTPAQVVGGVQQAGTRHGVASWRSAEQWRAEQKAVVKSRVRKHGYGDLRVQQPQQPPRPGTAPPGGRRGQQVDVRRRSAPVPPRVIFAAQDAANQQAEEDYAVLKGHGI